MIKRITIILHFYSETLYFAIEALKLNKLRAFLSLIGITIGIFSIITVFSVLDSMEKAIRTSIESLGSNILYIQKWPWEFSNDYPWWKYLNRPVSKIKEANELSERLTLADVVCYTAKTMGSIEYNGKEISDIPLLFSSHDFDKVRNFEIEKGRYFSEYESKRGSKKVILGSVLSNLLFSGQNPIGKQVTINNIQYTVLGVFKKEGTGIFDQGMDNAVLIPVNSVMFYFDFDSDMMDPSIIVKAKPSVSLDDLTNEIRLIMRSIRRIRPSDEDNFAINKASVITQGFNELFGVIDIAGMIIGGFSILVGGFGIANIMFVSVKERTKLIGIQKAIGAKNQFILFQFLNEAVILSLIGGIFGLIFVWLAIFYSDKFVDMSITLSLSNIMAGILISVIIGIISGFAPAWAAAKLNPVEAINSNF
ncbi:MAG: ABC transporter permease [Bacteroidales bacterium]|nr:ABC transporter permease [Bacteroidales bacterium]